jgi:hypothetical protein
MQACGEIQMITRSQIVTLLITLFVLLSHHSHANESIYKFQKTPEYMLLRINPDQRYKSFEGYTASLWSGEFEKYVFGKYNSPGKITLTFYNIKQYNKAQEVLMKDERFKNNRPGPDINIFDYLGEHLQDREPIFQGKYEYYKLDYKLETKMYDPYYPKGVWKKTGISDEYTNLMLEFYDIWDSPETYSAEAILTSSKLEDEYGFGGCRIGEICVMESNTLEKESLQRPIVRLFGIYIPTKIVGLPTQVIYTTQQYCREMRGKLLTSLKQAGNWDVAVDPEEYNSFRIQLKSHSDKEFYYKDKIWWKALLEIEFVGANEKPNSCSQIKCRLYDSVVCPGPINDDPEAPGKGRSACFERIHYGSDAEYKLAERVSSSLRSTFGTPE